jgi:hypothetical protein
MIHLIFQWLSVVYGLDVFESFYVFLGGAQQQLGEGRLQFFLWTAENGCLGWVNQGEIQL